MEVFPADVVAEILSRLPVKPLLRFRSVSKIWCSLIDSDHFIKLHLHRSIHSKNHRKLLIRSHIIDSITLDSLDVAEKPNCPLVPRDEYILGLSSCNGLVMLWTSADTVVIWNPSTHKCQNLPPFKPKFDYKLFKLHQLHYRHGFESDIQVYSLKLNTWRTIKDFPYYLCNNVVWKIYDGVFAHGALHVFVAKIYDQEFHPDRYVAALDIATEETRLVPLPDFGGSNNNVRMDLVAFEGCLCLVAYPYKTALDPQLLGMWVMKDYGGVGESWNELFSAAQLSVIGSFRKLLPLAYSKNGCEIILLHDYGELLWFDLERNAVRKIEVHGLSNLFDAEVLVQSLVPLGSGGKTSSDKLHIRDKEKSSQRRLNEKFGNLKSSSGHVISKLRFLCKALNR